MVFIGGALLATTFNAARKQQIADELLRPLKVAAIKCVQRDRAIMITVILANPNAGPAPIDANASNSPSAKYPVRTPGQRGCLPRAALIDLQPGVRAPGIQVHLDLQHPADSLIRPPIRVTSTTNLSTFTHLVK